MSHMTALGSSCSDTSGCSSRVVTYTATGSEGTDFSVSIGATLASAAYDVFPAPAGVTAVPVMDLPTTGRTTTTFPVSMSVAPTLGDVFKFLIVE